MPNLALFYFFIFDSIRTPFFGLSSIMIRLKSTLSRFFHTWLMSETISKRTMFGNLWGCVRLTAIKCGARGSFSGQSAIGNIKKSVVAFDSAGNKKIHSTSSLSCIADGGGGTHKPTPFQKKVFVWTKVYKTEADVPDRVTRSQMKNAMDKFRVRVSIGMVAMTFIFAAMMALVGRKARNEGQTITQISLARRQE